MTSTHSINKNLLKSHFDLQAPHYDHFGNLQKKIADQLLLLIRTPLPGTPILEIGTGTGYLSKAIFKKFYSTRLLSIDFSAQMLKMARRQFHEFQRLFFIQADGECLPFQGKFSALISSSTFQWFTDLQNALKNYYSLLCSQGCLYFTLFVEGTFQELIESFQIAYQKNGLKPVRPAPLYYNVGQIENYLTKNLFQIRLLETVDEISIFPSFDELHYSIKKIGASHAPHKLNWLPKSVVKESKKYYQDRFRIKEGGLKVTNRILYGVAERV